MSGYSPRLSIASHGVESPRSGSSAGSIFHMHLIPYYITAHYYYPTTSCSRTLYELHHTMRLTYATMSNAGLYSATGGTVAVPLVLDKVCFEGHRYMPLFRRRQATKNVTKSGRPPYHKCCCIILKQSPFYPSTSVRVVSVLIFLNILSSYHPTSLRRHVGYNGALRCFPKSYSRGPIDPTFFTPRRATPRSRYKSSRELSGIQKKYNIQT